MIRKKRKQEEEKERRSLRKGVCFKGHKEKCEILHC